MQIIHTSDFKNNTILAERGIKCVIRGYAFVKDTKKWLEKKHAARYDFEDITLEELCNNTVLVTDEDKNDPDVLNNLFDVTFEPCLELTVPEIQDQKGTVLGGEKFGTYKIRINSALNNKTRNGIKGKYKAIVLIGEKYTEDKWHVITENKSYIAMFLYFGAGETPCFAEKDGYLEIGDDTAFTINLQFSLSQVSPEMIADINTVNDSNKYTPVDPNATSFKIDLDDEYAAILAYSEQKDQTTTQLSIPGAFLVPSGKEYKTRLEIENGRIPENEDVMFLDKTFNLIPNTYKNNNIFNVTPRVNIFDEHDDKFVKPQLMLSYGGAGKDKLNFTAQSIGFEYDNSYFKLNEKAPTGDTRFDLFGGATKRENAGYIDGSFNAMSGYLRLLSDRGYHYPSKDGLFIDSTDNVVGMDHGSMITSDSNTVVAAPSGKDAGSAQSMDTHLIDTRGTVASGLSGGLLVDCEHTYVTRQDGVTAFGSQQASATISAGLYNPAVDDPYRCPDCDGTGKVSHYITKYISTFYIRRPYSDPSRGDYFDFYAVKNTYGNVMASLGQTETDIIPEDFDLNALIKKAFDDGELTYSDLFVTAEEAKDALDEFASSQSWPSHSTKYNTGNINIKTGICYFAILWSNSRAYYEIVKHDDEYENWIYADIAQCDKSELPAILQAQADEGKVGNTSWDHDTLDAWWGFATEAEAQAAAEACIAAGFNTDQPPIVLSAYVYGAEASDDPCPRCGGDGRFGYYGLPGRLGMMGLNVSSMEFNGYNNFFIGHKGLLSNFGHDAIIFGNHNACGNKEYDMCEACSGTGRVKCTACADEETGEPIGKTKQHPIVQCSSCFGFGRVNYSAEVCTYCSGTGEYNGNPCPFCHGMNLHSGVSAGEENRCWENFYTCSAYTASDAAIYDCPLCQGKGEITDYNTTAWLLCPECSGYGQMQCPTCTGAGFIEGYEHALRTSACPTCKDSLMKCPVCDGKGFTGEDPLSSMCNFCSGDRQVCKICSGYGTYECPDCSGYNAVPCPECNNDTVALIDCPLCSGAGILSTDDKARIMAYLPSASTFDTLSPENIRDTFYNRLFYNRCYRCNGSGIINEKGYAHVFYREGFEYVYVGWLKQIDYHETTTWALTETIDDAYLFQNSIDAYNALQEYIAYAHPEHDLGYEMDSIPETCPNCQGCGGYDATAHEPDKRMHCPCCNNLRRDNVVSAVSFYLTPGYYTTGSYDYSAYREYYNWGTDPENSHIYSGYDDNRMLALIDNHYAAGVPGGKIYSLDRKVGYHKCDLCNGKQYLAVQEWDKLTPFLGTDAKSLLKDWTMGLGQKPGFVSNLVVGGFYGGPVYGILCPKCCNMPAIKNLIDFYEDHDKLPPTILQNYYDTFAKMNYYNNFNHGKFTNSGVIFDDGGYTAACMACNYLGNGHTITTFWTSKDEDGRLRPCTTCDGAGWYFNISGERITCPDCEGKNRLSSPLAITTLGWIECPECVSGAVACEACNGTKHWYCTTCSGDGMVEYRPTVAYEDGGVIKVGDGYFYKNLMQNQATFDMYRDYINIKPDNNCDLDVGQYLKRMNLFSVENHGMLMVHNNNYDEIPDSVVKHNLADDFFAVRAWAQYDSLSDRFANLQQGCYSPEAIYFSKRTTHNEEWKLRIRELDYLIHDNYIKTNASMLKTAALNQAISEFYKNNNTFLLRLGPIITYRWEAVKGSKGAKGTKGWKGRKGIKGTTLGMKGKKGMKGLKGLKGTKGYKGMTLKVVEKRYKYYIEDILKAVQTEFGKYISNNGNLGKNPETYTFYCINGDPSENLYFKGVRLRKMANGNYQTLNAVKGIKPSQVQRIIYKDNGYYGEYGVMNFNYAYNNKFLT